MNKKVSLLIGTVLLVLGVCFIVCAVYFPAAFPWSNRVTYLLCGGYLWLMFKFLLDIPFLQGMRKTPPNGSLFRAVLFLLMAVVFLLMQLTTETASIYTGFIVVGGLDEGGENLFRAVKQGRNNVEAGQNMI
ncbi:MAG: hypothetical protein LUG65_05935 [Clostridiales bacterium]|nr:hypothetical protein [Clostridiales bacterium]